MTTEQAITETDAGHAPHADGAHGHGGDAAQHPAARHDTGTPFTRSGERLSEQLARYDDQGGDPDDPAGQHPDRVPDVYEFDVPDGVAVSEDMAESWGAEFRDLGLSQSQAQRLVDKFADQQLQQAETSTRMLDDLRREVESSPDFGGPDMDRKLQTAKKVLDVYGSDRLRQEVIESYAGSHIELIRLLDKVGKELSRAGKLGEDNRFIHSTASAGNSHQARLQKLYPKTRVSGV